MARPKGRRNDGYEDEKDRLAELIMRHLISEGGADASFRKLAAACDVNPATLRHYFGDRNGAVIAAMEVAHHLGDQGRVIVAKGEMGTVREALLSLFRFFMMGWKNFDIGDVQRFGLKAALGEPVLGPAYINKMFEPTLDAFEQRIQHHINTGELRPCTVRVAALQLLSPVLLALLHQHELCGDQERPLDLEAFLVEHIDTFLRAYEPQAQ